MAIRRIVRSGITGITQKNIYGYNPNVIVSSTVTPVDIGGYRIYTYTSPGTFLTTTTNAVPNTSYPFEYLVAAGGGSGGFDAAGGGGAGGLRTGTVNFTGSTQVITTQAITVGAAANNSAFGTVASCTRGGNGGNWNSGSGAPGGSGGGGAGAGPGTGGGGGGAGTAGEGNPGSPGSWNPGPYAGGGGGAGGAGGAFGSPGAGLSNSISGTAVTYSQGGAGMGGGFTGSGNTGSGGRGGAYNMGTGSPGAAGVVIIRYQL